jgi:voltage-gated potassium channel Kch
MLWKPLPRAGGGQRAAREEVVVSSEQVAEPGRLSWSARIVFSVVAVVAFVLGVIGFGELLEKGTTYLQPGAEYARGPLDLVYYSLQLFVLDAAPMQSVRTLPLALQIARFAAPAVTIYLIFLAVQGLLAQRLYQARIRLTRGHSVLCGPPDTVAQFAEQIRRETGGKTVIVAGVGQQPPGRRQLCVVGDPRQRQVLERAGAHRAREVIVVGPDSIRNAEVAIAVHAVNRKKRSAVTCYAEAQDSELVEMVVGQEVGPGEANRLDTFNRHEPTVRELLDQLPPWPPSDPRSAVLVIGYGDLGRVLVDRLVHFWSGGSASGSPIPRLCVLDSDVPVEDVKRRHADAGGRLTVSARRKDPSWLTTIEDLLVPAADGSHSVPGRVYVCLDDDATGIAVGKTALRLLAGEETTIVVAVPHSSVLGQPPAGTDLARDPSGPTPIRTIESARLVLISVVHIVAHSVYTVAAMRLGANEELARAIHEIYRQQAMDQGATVDTNESVRPWDELPDYLKDSNREQAWDLSRKLAAIGLSAVPTSGSTGDVTLTEADVEKLAKAEHRRWMAERIAKDWRHGHVRDYDRKLHPELVEWEYLSEDSRNKDRSAVRAIPKHLAAVGLQIVRAR